MTDLREYKSSGMRLGTSNCESWCSSVGHCFQRVVVVVYLNLQSFSLFWENFEELSAAN